MNIFDDIKSINRMKELNTASAVGYASNISESKTVDIELGGYMVAKFNFDLMITEKDMIRIILETNEQPFPKEKQPGKNSRKRGRPRIVRDDEN